MNSIYLGQINEYLTKENIKAFENNASALDGMSAMLASIGDPNRYREKALIDESAAAIRRLKVIAESLFGEYERKYEECERLEEIAKSTSK